MTSQRSGVHRTDAGLMREAAEEADQPDTVRWDEGIPWPKTIDDVTAEKLITYGWGRDLFLGEQLWQYVSTDREDIIRWVTMIEARTNNHRATDLLRRLLAVDPAAALEAAKDSWLMSEAGDSYDEWAWQRAKECGLDPDLIIERSRAAIAKRKAHAEAVQS